MALDIMQPPLDSPVVTPDGHLHPQYKQWFSHLFDVFRDYNTQHGNKTPIVTETERDKTINGNSPIPNGVNIHNSTNSRQEVNINGWKKYITSFDAQGSIPFPSYTTTERNAISSPPDGLAIFNTTINMPQMYYGSAWHTFTLV